MSVSGAFDKLSKKRKDAVRLVFEHNLTTGEIAKKIGVGESTIRRWKKDPAFIHALHDYSLNKLNNALPLAIQQSYELLENPKTSAMVKFQLIQMLFKYANLLFELPASFLMIFAIGILSKESLLNNTDTITTS